MSNRAVTTRLSHNEGAGTYLAARDAKHDVNPMNGVGSHADTPSGDGDVQSVQTRAIKPSRSTRMPPDEPNGIGDHMDASNTRMDVQGDGNEAEMSNAREIVMPKHTY